MRSMILLAGLVLCGCTTEATESDLAGAQLDEAQLSEFARECGYVARCAAGYIWSGTACQCLPAASAAGQDNAAGHDPDACGDSVCGATSYCCNESCGICAPEGSSCIQIACVDDEE